MKIVVVEDNQTFAKQLAMVLNKEGHIVEIYNDGNSFLENFSNDIDLLLLDINLPDTSGLEILKILRESKFEVKTIFISSHTEIEYLKKAFDLDCEDYIKKPLELDELLLRVKKVEKTIKPKNLVVMGNYKFDLENFFVMIDDKEIKLTKQDVKLLSLFLTNINKVVSFDYINSQIWDSEALTNTITVAVLRLRKKLNLDNLENIRDVGYIFHNI